MAIKKVPKNYDTTLNRRKQHLNDIVDALNNVTTVEANPEGSSTRELNTLKVGETIYSVNNKPSFDTIKKMKITTSNGGEYCTSLPKIEFLDDKGNVAPITLNTDYTFETEHSLQYGGLSLTDFPGVANANTPNTYTATFNDFNTHKYHLIRMTRGGTFPFDLAKDIKIELSTDGTNFFTIYDETTITWSSSVTSHLIDITTGEEAAPILPIVTSSDSQKFLQVSNGEWKTSDIKIPSHINSDKYFVKTKASNQSLVFEEYPFDVYRIAPNGKFRNEDGDALTYSDFLELEDKTKFYIVKSSYGAIITGLYDVPKDDSLTGECYICLSFPYINSADGTPITKTYRATFDNSSLNNEVAFTLLS